MARATSTARQTQESPAGTSFDIVPNDSSEVGTYLPRAVYVGGAGNIVAMLEGDTEARTFFNVQAGSLLPLKVRVVMETGTTATNLVGLY